MNNPTLPDDEEYWRLKREKIAWDVRDEKDDLNNCPVCDSHPMCCTDLRHWTQFTTYGPISNNQGQPPADQQKENES